MSMRSSQPRAFILDFDGTITEKDTIGVLARSAIEWQQRTKGVDMRGVWEQIVTAYGRDLDHHVAKYKPVEEDRTTTEEEEQYLRSLREVEERSFGRVSDSELFKGMGRDAWEDVGRQAVEKGDVVVRKGFTEFVRRVREQGDRWGIVSVNFSGPFIRGVVQASAGPEEVEILANSSDEDGILLGPQSELGKAAATSDAKVAAMKDLLKSWSHGGVVDTSRPIYVGDSGADTECLMEHGVIGIIMTSDGYGSLMATMKRTGLDVVHVDEIEVEVEVGEEQSSTASSRKLCWARDFDEILQSPLFYLQ